MMRGASSSVSRDQQTPPLTYHRRVSPICRGSRRNSVYNIWRSHRWQHAMKRVMSKIVIFLYPTCIRRPHKGSRRNIAIKFDVEKLEWYGYPMVKNHSKICLLVWTEYTNVTDRQTDTAWQRRPHLQTASRTKKRCNIVYAGDCTELLPGCTTIWNTDVRQLFLRMVSGVAQPAEVQAVCRCVW